jgi:hypothetical protein
MVGRHVALYFAWNRPEETGVPDNRFASLFEIRRIYWERTKAWTGNLLRLEERVAATRTLFDDVYLSTIDSSTIWSSVVGGLESLERSWQNVLQRLSRGALAL